MGHQTDRTIDNIHHHLTALTRELPDARRALLEQRIHIDGYPPGNNNPHIQATAELTPTEAAAHQRQHIDTMIRSLDEELHAIDLTARNLRNDCQHHINTPTPTTGRRCDATGRDGNLEWADPTCTNHASRGPLCDRCSKREYRWRQTQGLPPRTDGVFSAPA